MSVNVIDYRQSHTGRTKGQQYDRRFQSFAWRKYLWEQERAVLLDILGKYFTEAPLHYLDFACGTGRIIEFMHDKVAHATGVDISGSMLKECVPKVPSAEIIHGDITRENVLGDRKFDIITAFRFFPNAQRELREEAMRALRTHLCENGLVVLNNHRNASSILFRSIALLRAGVPTMHDREVIALVGKIGLSIDRVYSIGLLPGYDNNPMILPRFVHAAADRCANALRCGRHLCQDNIYVCRKVERNLS